MTTRFSTLLALTLATAALAACRDGMAPLAGDDTIALASGSGDRVELSATFTVGDAKARFRSRGNQQELQVEVEDLAPGTMIDLLVGGIVVGTEIADGLGNINLNHNTNVDGPFPAGFAVAPGTSVLARTAGGDVVAQGAF